MDIDGVRNSVVTEIVVAIGLLTVKRTFKSKYVRHPCMQFGIHYYNICYISHVTAIIHSPVVIGAIVEEESDGVLITVVAKCVVDIGVLTVKYN